MIKWLLNIINRGKPIAVVTGGKNGNLGPIISNELKRLGYRVFALDLPDYDISKQDYVDLFKLDLPGIPKLIVNNAAIDNPPTGKSGYFSNYEQILDVNLMGALRVINTFIPDMIGNGGGVIINIGSIMGNVAADWRNYPTGFRKPVAYGLSKAALIQLSRSLTMEYGNKNIRSVCCAFGPVDTGKFKEPFRSNILRSIPTGRFISEKSVRATIRYAVECPELAGQQILCDGGYTCW
jgi:NAD(P)-dependent dehydrogenase (short-subunit alcohol dehydrogenase family)